MLLTLDLTEGVTCRGWSLSQENKHIVPLHVLESLVGREREENGAIAELALGRSLLCEVM